MKRFIISLLVAFMLAMVALPAHADTSCVFTTSFFVRVRSFMPGTDNWNNYIPAKPPYGYPATDFLQYFQSATSFTHDTMLINMSSGWLKQMQIANGSMWNYLHSASDGTFFNGSKLGVDTFPGNVLMVIGKMFKRGQCFDQIATSTYNANNVLDINSLPAWLVSYQTNQHFSTLGFVSSNGIEKIPILYDPNVGSKYNMPSQYRGLWLPDADLEVFPALPMTITTLVNVNMRVNADQTSSITETALVGTQLNLTLYSVLQGRTMGYVTDPAKNKSGWVSLIYWPYGNDGHGLQTTTWQMQTLPVPPG